MIAEVSGNGAGVLAPALAAGPAHVIPLDPNGPRSRAFESAIQKLGSERLGQDELDALAAESGLLRAMLQACPTPRHQLDVIKRCEEARWLGCLSPHGDLVDGSGRRGKIADLTESSLWLMGQITRKMVAELQALNPDGFVSNLMVPDGLALNFRPLPPSRQDKRLGLNPKNIGLLIRDGLLYLNSQPIGQLQGRDWQAAGGGTRVVAKPEADDAAARRPRARRKPARSSALPQDRKSAPAPRAMERRPATNYTALHDRLLRRVRSRPSVPAGAGLVSSICRSADLDLRPSVPAGPGPVPSICVASDLDLAETLLLLDADDRFFQRLRQHLAHANVHLLDFELPHNHVRVLLASALTSGHMPADAALRVVESLLDLPPLSTEQMPWDRLVPVAVPLLTELHDIVTGNAVFMRQYTAALRLKGYWPQLIPVLPRPVAIHALPAPSIWPVPVSQGCRRRLQSAEPHEIHEGSGGYGRKRARKDAGEGGPSRS